MSLRDGTEAEEILIFINMLETILCGGIAQMPWTFMRRMAAPRVQLGMAIRSSGPARLIPNGHETDLCLGAFRGC